MNLELVVTSHDLSISADTLVQEVKPILEDYFGEAEVLKTDNGDTKGFEKIFPHAYFLTSYEGKVTGELRKSLHEDISKLITKPYKLSFVGINKH